jgi:hypothetical protein
MSHHDIDHVVYCENCMVVEVGMNDKYCDGCAQEMVDEMALRYDEMAVRYREGISVEEGWY